MSDTLTEPLAANGASMWRSVSAAPHRLFFLAGASYTVIVATLWAVQQTSLYTDLLPPFAFVVPHPFAHGWMMVYGVLAFYIFGFLLTTFPRWLDGTPVNRRVYLTAWGLLIAGGHLFWIGLFLSPVWVAAGGLMTLAGHGVATVQCISILTRSTNPARYQQGFISAGLAAAMAGMVVGLWAILSGEAWAYRLSLVVGLDLFLLVVIFAVVYRMVPFFTSVMTPGLEPRRSPYAIHLFTTLLVLRLGASWLDLPFGSALADGGLLAVLVVEMVRWRFWLAPRPPLLVILYLALAWIALGLALSCGEAVHRALTEVPSRPLQMAALHAITVGGFGSLMLGISTRVSLGHSGGGLVTDRLIAALFYLFQLIPLARVLPELLVPWLPSWSMQGFWSGYLWAALFAAWLWRFAPLLLAPRSDGRPG